MASLTFTDDSGVSYKLPLTAEVTPVPTPTPEPEPEPEPAPPPASVSTIPLSWESPLFAGVVSSGAVTLASGATLLNKSIAVHNEPASVVMNGGSATAPTTLKNVRVGKLSREGVRIGGGSYLIDGCYLEATGQGADHADTIQAYAGSGAKFVLTIRNSLIRAHEASATAGVFVADNCTGDVNLDNVVFQGGPFGLRLHADVGGDINVAAKDVFFVGPFGTAPFYFLNYGGGKVVIKQWDNVRAATIVNGVLIEGDPIPRP